MVVKKEYKKPVVQFIELRKEDVLTGNSGPNKAVNTSGDELLNDIVTDDISPIE